MWSALEQPSTRWNVVTLNLLRTEHAITQVSAKWMEGEGKVQFPLAAMQHLFFGFALIQPKHTIFVFNIKLRVTELFQTLILN